MVGDEIEEKVFIPHSKTPMLKDAYPKFQSQSQDDTSDEEEGNTERSFNLNKYLSVDVDVESDSQVGFIKLDFCCVVNSA